MADHITLSLVGFRDAEIALVRWGAAVEADCRAELADEIAATVSEIQAATRIGKTGNLRKGIKGKVEAVGVSGTIRSAARHAHLVEWGHKGPHKAPPYPSFVPRVIRARQRFYARVKRVLAKPLLELGPGVPDVVESSGRLL